MTHCRAKQRPSRISYPTGGSGRPVNQRGFTLVEVIVVMAILAVLTSVALPAYSNLKDQARVARAATELRDIEKMINAFSIDKAGVFPSSLEELQQGIAEMKDPWGAHYVYINIANASTLPAQLYPPRKDDVHLDQPLNTDFDLYSLGADRDTSQYITNNLSQDDIVRAGDGGFFGLGRDYLPAE